MSTVIIITQPEAFEVPEDWDGAVTRDGHTLPQPIKARDWQSGDEVECLLRIRGRLTPVKFKVGVKKRMQGEVET